MNEEKYREEFRKHFISKIGVNNRSLFEDATKHERGDHLNERTPSAPCNVRQKHHSSGGGGGDGDSCLYNGTRKTDLGSKCMPLEQSKHKRLPQKCESVIEMPTAIESPLCISSMIVNDPTSSNEARPVQHQCNSQQIRTIKDKYPMSNSSAVSSNRESVLTKISSRSLREKIKSQCKLKKALDESLKSMIQPDFSVAQHLNSESIPQKQRDNSAPPPQSHPPQIQYCHCQNNPHHQQPNKCSTSKQHNHEEVASRRNIQQHSAGDQLYVDDFVNTNVIFPMIRRIQRMYLTSMQQEMTLIEDLERIPSELNGLLNEQDSDTE